MRSFPTKFGNGSERRGIVVTKEPYPLPDGLVRPERVYLLLAVV